MNDRLRRHARLIAGSVALLLVAGVGYVLQAAGSAHAQGARAVAQVHAIAPILAPAAQRAGRGVPSARASGSHGRTAAVARVSAVRPGLRTPPPSQRGALRALRQVTGLSPAQVTSRPVCPRPAPGHATCAARASCCARPARRPPARRAVPLAGPGEAGGRLRSSAGVRDRGQPAPGGHPGLSPAGLRPVLPVGEPRGAATRWRSSTPTTIRPPRRSLHLPLDLRPAGVQRLRTAASGRSIRTGTSPFPAPTRAGSRRSRSTSTRCRRSARTARSCSWRPTPTASPDLQAAMHTARQPRRGPDLGQLERAPRIVPSGFDTFGRRHRGGDRRYRLRRRGPGRLPGRTSVGDRGRRHQPHARRAAPSARGLRRGGLVDGSDGGGSGCDLQ